jgi:hypothetical protein
MQFSVDHSIPSLATFYTGTAIQAAPKHTGRLPLSGSQEGQGVPSSVFNSSEPGVVPSTMMERINYRHSCTPLNQMFFSQVNVANLQSKIKADVLARSNGKYSIDNQSEADLMIIMRSYYLQYGDNDPNVVAKALEEFKGYSQDLCGLSTHALDDVLHELTAQGPVFEDLRQLVAVQALSVARQLDSAGAGEGVAQALGCVLAGLAGHVCHGQQQ